VIVNLVNTSMMLHQRRTTSIQFLLLILVGTVMCFSAGCAGKQPAPPEVAQPAPVEVATTQQIIMGEWTELLGATQPLPSRSARISAAVESRVLWLLRDPEAKNGQTLAEGQRVETGQVIGKLDDRLVRADREKLQTTLEETKEQKNQADFAVEAANLEYTRLLALSKNPMNNGAFALTNPIELQKARIQLNAAQSKLKETDTKLKGIDEELKALDEKLDLYLLKAPITGKLGSVQAVPGQTLAIGATVAEVVDLDNIDALCFVPPYTATRLALGQKARVVTDQGNPITTGGEIAFIAVQAQPDTGSFAVKARFKNPDLKLRSGSVVRVQVLTNPEEPRVAIDERALLEDQEPPSVVIVRDLHVEVNPETKKEEKIGTARKLIAVTGVRDRQFKRVEILGLKDPKTKEEVPLNDEVLFVVKGGHGLEGDSKEGDKVKLEEEEE
jgi:RND family efflux transporter MFP subunit